MAINKKAFCMCSTCLFFRGGEGRCHRHAPLADNEWPLVQPNELCGEYRNKITAKTLPQLTREAMTTWLKDIADGKIPKSKVGGDL
jgi:hypothetical protein